MNTEDNLDIYLEQIAKIPLLTAKQEVDLTERMRAGDKQAREKLITSNLRLVVKFAKQNTNKGVSLEDLIQAGNEGLLKTVDKYDVKLLNKATGAPYRFSTYAAYWIKHTISRSIENESRTIRLPVHTNEDLARINKIEKSLITSLGRDPTPEQIAEELALKYPKNSLTADEVATLQSHSAPISLNAVVNDGAQENNALRQDQIVKDGLNDYTQTRFGENEDTIDNIYAKEMIRQAVARIPSEQDRAVLRMRYGLDTGQTNTLEEVGERLGGITREAVRLREMRAIAFAATLPEFQVIRDVMFEK